MVKQEALFFQIPQLFEYRRLFLLTVGLRGELPESRGQRVGVAGFEEDDVLRLMHKYSVTDDDEYGLITYLPAITYALCKEAVDRMRIYSPHMEK